MFPMPGDAYQAPKIKNCCYSADLRFFVFKEFCYSGFCFVVFVGCCCVKKLE